MQARRLMPLVLASALVLVGCGKDAPGSPPGAAATVPAGTAGCPWPAWGHGPSRTFSSPCPTRISPATAKDLTERWFFNTHDVVTASPAVVDGTVYVGDWSGRFYALDAATGARRWVFQADVAARVYAGQIVSSAAVAEVGGVDTVYFGDGPVLYALRADNGELRWRTDIGTGAADDFTEIESSPIVVEGMVIFGTDVHNHRGQRAGVFALDAATGAQVWFFDGDEGAEPSGCVDVWGSPSVDVARDSVFFGTGSCDTADMLWRPLSEAIVAVDLRTGARKWAYQPHQASRADLDFAGAPNLFEIDGRAVLGLGNKDGTYYTLDRETGAVVWKTEVAKGSATGGFIGGTAVARGIIAGGTAVGGAPFLHGLDARTGAILWQQPRAQATYGSAAEAGGVVFIGGNDFTFRAVDLATGGIVWSRGVNGAVAGGAAVVGDDVFVPTGIRQPGVDKRSENSGVYRFSIAPGGGTTTTTRAPTGTTPRATGVTLTNSAQACIGSPCPIGFLKGIPAGITAPEAQITIEPAPFSVRVTSKNLGDPNAWITPGTDAATEGATSFGVFISESDDNPVGGLLCVIDASGACSADSLPRLATYNRVTILAVRDTAAMPAPADGLARLVATVTLRPPLTPSGLPATTTTQPGGAP